MVDAESLSKGKLGKDRLCFQNLRTCIMPQLFILEMQNSRPFYKSLDTTSDLL
jgi:hypothetical protein